MVYVRDSGNFFLNSFVYVTVYVMDVNDNVFRILFFNKMNNIVFFIVIFLLIIKIIVEDEDDGINR